MEMNPNIITIVRKEFSDQGTKGVLITSESHCFTLELPWRENRPNVSCIPSGTYYVEMRRSPRLGKHYWIKDVQDRSWVLIHSGNLAGDIEKGYISHVQGCILLGSKYGLIKNQLAILFSKPTVSAFENYMEEKPFILNIQNFKEVM
jgi:hypothetical protein